MKRLDSLPTKKIIELIYTSRELTSMLDNDNYCMYNDEMEEYLYSMKDSGASITGGMYEKTRLSLVNPEKFFEYCSRYTDMIDDEFDRQYRKCIHLKKSNLFSFEVGRLGFMLCRHLDNIAEFYENIGYDIYRKEVTEEIEFLVEDMVMNDRFDGIFVKDDGKIVSIKEWN